MTYVATLQAMLLTMIMSTITYTLFYVKDKRKKVLLFACIGLAIAYDMILATRTLIVISIITFCITFLIHMKWNKHKIKKYMIILGGILGTIGILIIIYSTNLFGIKDTLKSKYSFFERLGDIATVSSDISRINAQIEALKEVFKYPIGGNFGEIAGLEYAHNMWLDVDRQAGIVPFALLITFFVLNIKDLIIVIKDKIVSRQIKMLLISVYIAMILNFLVEPVLQGAAHTFACFVIIMGMVNQKADMIKKEKVQSNSLGVHTDIEDENNVVM